MVEIEKDRWNTKYFSINGKWIGRADHYSFNLSIDRESGDIYSEDTDYCFTLEEITEFVRYLKRESNGRNKR